MKTHVIECTSHLFEGLEQLGFQPTWVKFPHSFVKQTIDEGDEILFKTVTAEGEEHEARTRMYRYRSCHHANEKDGWKTVLLLTPILDFQLKEVPF